MKQLPVLPTKNSWNHPDKNGYNHLSVLPSYNCDISRTRKGAITTSATNIKSFIKFPEGRKYKGGTIISATSIKLLTFSGQTNVTKQGESRLTAGHKGDTQPDATYYEWLPVWFTDPVRLTPSHAMQCRLLSCCPTTFRNTSLHGCQRIKSPRTWPRYM